jgi:murein DD-endopeptidase MepM/ murein hydrolase activator NlpD
MNVQNTADITLQPLLAQQAERARSRELPVSPDELRKATQEFEALFLSHLLKVMRSTVESADEESAPGKDVYLDLLDNEMAMNIARGQSLGIGEMMYRQILETRNAETPAAAARVPVVDGDISSGYGLRRDPLTGALKFHEGVDISAIAGTPFRSAQPGVVVFADRLGSYGNTVIVQHENGDRALYGHASGIVVRPGDRVEAQQVLGTVGNTGRTTGPHLHFELQRNGRVIDPSGEAGALRRGGTSRPI